MHRRRGIFGVFLFFIFVSMLLFFAFRIPLLSLLTGYVQFGTNPIQRVFHIAFWGFNHTDVSLEKLREENTALRQKLIQVDALKRENAALHDQFETTDMLKYEQIEVNIIGTKGFIPGVSLPSELTIDRGSTSHIEVGNVLVYKNSLIGVVTRVTPHVSVVEPLTRDGVSFTARDLKTGSLGVVRGQGDGIILDNVVLADKLNVGDTVVSKGDMNNKGIGIPPDLVVGKISSLDRHPSNLFQSGEIQSLVDITKLSTAFVIRMKQ